MTRLVADNLTVRRGGRVILDDVSLAAEHGQFIALLGPNGAGKSTLLTHLAGLAKPDEGSVTLDGTSLPAIGLQALAHRRAYLPQSPRAEWPVSVERLVALGLLPQLPAFGDLPADLSARVTDVLEQVDLLAQRHQPATTLSGGELARAMLARALVGNPDMVLADEPLAGLDPRHAIDGIARLRAAADAGKLVIAAVHDIMLAARYATHIAMLREGKLIAFGETGETLTSALLAQAFDIDAQVASAGTPNAMVNFRPA